MANTESPVWLNGPSTVNLPFSRLSVPRLAWHGAEADALVGADLVLLVGIEDFVGESEEIADAVALRADVGDRVGRGVFGHFCLLRIGRGRTGRIRLMPSGDRHNVQQALRPQLQRLRHDTLP